MTDKPAATVHGTESGEAKPSCITYVGRDDIAQRIIDIVGDRRVPECELKLRVQAYLDTYASAPTPPASPTVTLDRETLVTLLEIVPQFPPSTRYGKAFEDAITRLRAAERQK